MLQVAEVEKTQRSRLPAENTGFPVCYFEEGAWHGSTIISEGSTTATSARLFTMLWVRKRPGGAVLFWNPRIY